MKLEKLALYTEIGGSLAVVVTLVILVAQLRENTAAIRAATRQSLSARAETLLLAQATPDLAKVHVDSERALDEATLKSSGLSPVEYEQFGAYLGANLRLTEEAYLQHRDGQLDEQYWQSRANGLLARLTTPLSRRVWGSLRQAKMFTPDFSLWLDEALAQRYGQDAPLPAAGQR